MGKNNSARTTNTILITISSAAVLTLILFVLYVVFTSTPGYMDPPPLTGLEEQWKEKIERNYHCRVVYLGCDEVYQEDSVTYIHIEHTNASPLTAQVSDSIELITGELATSFLDETDPGRTQSHILLQYENLSEPAKRETNIPAAKRCYYDIRQRAVIPNIQRLIVYRFAYRQIDTDGDGLWLQHLGGDLRHYYYFNDLKRERGFQKINEHSYKGLDHCETWETKTPQKIWLPNGSMELTQQYVFHRDLEISTVLTYKVYPEDSTLTYRDIVQKLTMKPRSPKNTYREDYSTAISRNYLSTEYLDYEVKKFGVRVKATADTTSIPWTIRYETAIDDLNYYSDIDYRYDD